MAINLSEEILTGKKPKTEGEYRTFPPITLI